jgi:sugar lactone lactonase YvrE/enterochelin esterase-like enzyme
MNRALSLVLLVLTSSLALADPAPPAGAPDAAAEPLGDHSKPGPDSKKQPGVPAGTQFGFKFDASKVFPGTVRSITVYVPAQYKGDKPACVYVGLDGLGFNVPVVFDNLISKGEMPVTIAIGISPGQVESNNAPADPRFNRSFEFDGLNDSLARLVLDEVLPAVEQHKTPDGLPILLSKDPNDRCTAGGSTGAIAAFTLAWERPDQFRRVFTAIGTFVGMRGGDRYPVLVRKTEPKPIRIFMQDGANDEWGGGPEVGDWWMGNQTLERALEFSGYQVEHSWGTGTHNGAHAAAIFPDVMRFLWKDWPQPIKAGQTQNHFLKDILQPDQEWQEVPGDYKGADALATGPGGQVVFRDSQARKTYRVSDDGKVGEIADPGQGVRGLAFGPDGRLLVAGDDIRALPSDDNAAAATIATGIHGQELIATHAGNIYVTEPGITDAEPSKVWLIKPNGDKAVVDAGLDHASGIAISPDGLWLAVVENKTHWGYSYRVQPDGSLQDKQRFYWLHVPDTADDSGAGSLCCDRDGRLYAATRLGVQVLDRNGRTRAIIPVPGGQTTHVCFGGTNFDTLFATGGGKVYQRKLKSIGAPAWGEPVKLPPWGAG